MSNGRKLLRALGLGYVIIFVISNILGSGVYKKVAPMAAELQSPGWILLAWAAAGIVTLFGALSNAEVAGLLADTGGDFVYLKRIYNRFIAFMYGWSLFTVIQSATIASLAYIFAQSLNSIIRLPDILPALNEFTLGGVFFPFSHFNIKLAAIGIILAVTSVNIMGLRSGARLGKTIFIIVTGGIMLIIISGLISSGASLLPAEPFTGAFAGVNVTFSSFFTAMLAAFWAYQGWSSVGFIGGEVKDPNRNIPRGIIAGTLIVIMVYLAVNYTYLSLLPVGKLTEINSSGTMIAAVEAVRSYWGRGGALFISLLILVTTGGCINASILTGARPYYAMAGERLFFRGIDRLNRHNVPGNSLLVQGIWSSILVLSGSFDQLTDMVIYAVFFFYGATALGVVILRIRMPGAERPYKVWGYPVVPVAYVVFCIVLIFNTILTRPREAAIGTALILAGIPVFLFITKGIASKNNKDNHEGSQRTH